MLSFMKVPPTTYVLNLSAGKIKREGAGLSFFYSSLPLRLSPFPSPAPTCLLFFRGDG